MMSHTTSDLLCQSRASLSNQLSQTTPSDPSVKSKEVYNLARDLNAFKWQDEALEKAKDTLKPSRNAATHISTSATAESVLESRGNFATQISDVPTVESSLESSEIDTSFAEQMAEVSQAEKAWIDRGTHRPKRSAAESTRRADKSSDSVRIQTLRRKLGK
ncbi:hypothetical protein IAT40_003487 [Kwoniella sp. CBS 6097]